MAKWVLYVGRLTSKNELESHGCYRKRTSGYNDITRPGVGLLGTDSYAAQRGVRCMMTLPLHIVLSITIQLALNIARVFPSDKNRQKIQASMNIIISI